MITNEIMRIFAKHDICDELYWSEELEFFVLCNDVFYWGCADTEAIETQCDIELLNSCFNDCEDHALTLYCARKRSMRPQRAMYKYLKGYESIFDLCGEERDPKELGNTPKPEVE